MRANFLADATETGWPFIHQERHEHIGSVDWCDDEQTIGYSEASNRPVLVSVHGNEGSQIYFVSTVDLLSEPRFIPCEFKFAPRDAELPWSAAATAHELVPSPSLIADLLSIEQDQLTDYRMYLTGVIEALRTALRSSLKPFTSEIAPPSVVEGDQNQWLSQIKEVKELADLTNDQLAELFHVSRTSVQGWLGGSGMRRTNRDHLRNVAAVIRDAAQRFATTAALHEALFSPIGPRHRRPFDYLTKKDYVTARGYLQRLKRHERRRRNVGQQVNLTESQRIESLEDLSPPPRTVGDHEQSS